MGTAGLALTRHYSSNERDLLQGCPTSDITAPRLVLLWLVRYRKNLPFSLSPTFQNLN